MIFHKPRFLQIQIIFVFFSSLAPLKSSLRSKNQFNSTHYWSKVIITAVMFVSFYTSRSFIFLCRFSVNFPNLIFKLINNGFCFFFRLRFHDFSVFLLLHTQLITIMIISRRWKYMLIKKKRLDKNYLLLIVTICVSSAA